MMCELDHRVKHTMAIVISLCDLTAGGSQSLPQTLQAYHGRLMTMARAHEALAPMRWKGVDPRFIIDAVFVGFTPSRTSSLTVQGDNLLLPPHVVLPMAVTLHELATNALKRGGCCLGSPHWHMKPLRRESGANELTLEWTERGGVSQDTTPGKGSGLSLIRSMTPHEPRWTVELEFAGDSVVYRVGTPIKNGRLDAFRSVA